MSGGYKHGIEFRYMFKIIVRAGHTPGSFWRMPTDLESWTPDMKDGMIARDGKVVAVSAFSAPLIYWKEMDTEVDRIFGDDPKGAEQRWATRKHARTQDVVVPHPMGH